jgi:hypothetical protein
VNTQITLKAECNPAHGGPVTIESRRRQERDWGQTRSMETVQPALVCGEFFILALDTYNQDYVIIKRHITVSASGSPLQH